MAIEIFYLTQQIHRWLNAQVAHHLAMQAEKLMTAHPIASPTFVSSESESTAPIGGAEIAEIDCAVPRDAAAGCPAAQMGMFDSEKQTVRA